MLGRVALFSISRQLLLHALGLATKGLGLQYQVVFLKKELLVVQLVAADANGEKVVHSSPASDMWALGVLAYEMFAGYVLANATNSEQHEQLL